MDLGFKGDGFGVISLGSVRKIQLKYDLDDSPQTYLLIGLYVVLQQSFHQFLGLCSVELLQVDEGLLTHFAVVEPEPFSWLKIL